MSSLNWNSPQVCSYHINGYVQYWGKSTDNSVTDVVHENLIAWVQTLTQLYAKEM